MIELNDEFGFKRALPDMKKDLEKSIVSILDPKDEFIIEFPEDFHPKGNNSNPSFFDTTKEKTILVYRYTYEDKRGDVNYHPDNILEFTWFKNGDIISKSGKKLNKKFPVNNKNDSSKSNAKSNLNPITNIDEDWWDDSKSFGAIQKSKDQRRQEIDSIREKLNNKYKNQPIQLNYQKFRIENVVSCHPSDSFASFIISLEGEITVPLKGYEQSFWNNITNKGEFKSKKIFRNLRGQVQISPPRIEKFELWEGEMRGLPLEFLTKESASIIFNIIKEMNPGFKPSMESFYPILIK